MVVVRCTGRLLTLLRRPSASLLDAPSDGDDWYANLLWVERRKCLLVVHAGTLFGLFAPDIRVGDLRSFERRIVDLISGALLSEDLPSDAFGSLEPSEVRVARTASRHVLGVMNQMAFEVALACRPGRRSSEGRGLDRLNHDLRRGLHTRDGGYRIPLDLARERLQARQ